MLYKEILVKSHLGKIEVKYYNSNQNLVSLSLNDAGASLHASQPASQPR
jgi:hypothetical protein